MSQKCSVSKGKFYFELSKIENEFLKSLWEINISNKCEGLEDLGGSDEWDTDPTPQPLTKERVQFLNSQNDKLLSENQISKEEHALNKKKIVKAFMMNLSEPSLTGFPSKNGLSWKNSFWTF